VRFWWFFFFIKINATWIIFLLSFVARYFGVQAVEKPKKPPKFGKIGHQNQGDADGQIYRL